MPVVSNQELQQYALKGQGSLGQRQINKTLMNFLRREGCMETVL